MKPRSEAKDLFKLLGASLAVVALACIIVAAGVAAFFFPYKSPPKEVQLLQNFQTHRATFEQLRDMLLEDKKLVRLSNWGVQTTTAITTNERPTADFSPQRYKQYLALLKEAGAIGVHRDRSDPPAGVCIWMYASGWAGDTRHVDICWEKETPATRVASLDDFYKTPKARKPVFRQIDGNWYLWADW
jgi:hypothetical protein